MSLQTFLTTVETDITSVVKVVEGDVEIALTAIWTAAKPLFMQAEPVIVQDVLAALQKFLTTAEASNDFAGIEQAFLQDLEAAGSELFGQAQGLGSTLLQVLIGLAKGALAKV